MTESVAGARRPLGPVRSAPRYVQLPADGAARATALDQLRSVISADVVRALEAAMAAGWHPLDHEDIADGYVVWMGRLVVGAVADGVHAWRDAQ